MIDTWSKKRVQFGVLLAWVAFTIFAFRYFTFERLIEFDLNGQLEGTNTAVFRTLLSQEYFSGLALPANTIINFISPECGCNKVTQIHINGLVKSAHKQRMSVLNMEPNHSSLVTSTPSVVITNNNSEVVYFGPYGAGLGCSNTEGLAQTVFDNYIKGFSADMIVADVKGCYCH
ncbi:MAG: DUF6436 domain-containing protein [Paraglaciecola sp.]|uniref:DUF6436 domain-containing protein n=1 Tax=Paraglaciecola sp. TaxID=1920173 RepID=UPI003267A4A1